MKMLVFNNSRIAASVSVLKYYSWFIDPNWSKDAILIININKPIEAGPVITKINDNK